MDSATSCRSGLARVPHFIDLKDITRGDHARYRGGLAYARELGYRISCWRSPKAVDGGVEVRVHPTMIRPPRRWPPSPACSTASSSPADAVGDLISTAAAPGSCHGLRGVSDVLEIARRIAHGIPALALDLRQWVDPAAAAADGDDPLPLLPCAFMAQDKPGVLSRWPASSAKTHLHRQRHPEGARHARGDPVVMRDARGPRADMRAALTKIDRLRDVAGATTMIR